MKFLLGLAMLIPLNWLPGVSGIFLLELAASLVIVGAATAFANSKALLPGTTSYRDRIALEHAQNGLELDRISRVRTRIQLLENDDINRIIALPPASTDEGT